MKQNALSYNFSRRGGFSLVELLVVLGIMAILISLVVAGFNSIGGAQSLASEASDFQQMLDDARAYAMANNTYVFVGIEEVDASQPASAVPQTLVSSTNGGRIAAVAVTSKDGTSALGTGSGVIAISKLRVFPNVHLQPGYAATKPLAGGGVKSWNNAVTASSPSPLANRALLPGRSYGLGFNIATPTIAATPASQNSEYFNWPISGPTQYSFNCVIQFSPDGSASMVAPSTNATAMYPPSWLEIDLQQMRGSALSTVYSYSSLNVAKAGQQVVAIQIDGITGNTQLYQQ